MADTVRYRSNPDYILRQVAGESVLVYAGEGGPFGNSILSLNESFSFLWKLFETPKTQSEAAAQARSVFTAPAGEIEAHVREFVSQCTQRGLIIKED